ncbi:MAG: glycosyltransferase family 39 protein [Phycisphaerales bacterium]|nr:MAG: glycosyltransferase family 39 protein [Phycisphaerales bacterium]
MIRHWAGPVAIVVAGFVMAYWSWRAWPDVLVDFGRELYVPWQLADGKVLYTDIAYLNGPLSPYLNALWFRIFGVSVLTLALCNICLLAVLVGLVFHLFNRISGRLAASCACLTLVTVFAFGQLISVGNYNFVCPYSHELTHGLILCTAAITCLSSYHRRCRLLWMVGAGLALGLTFLTKVEVFLPGSLAVAVGLSLIIWIERPGPRTTVKLLTAFVASALVPPIIALGLLSTAMPAGEALHAMAGSWSSLLGSELVSLDFYRKGMGLLDAGANLKFVLAWIGGYLFLFLPIGVLSMFLRRPGAYRLTVALIVSLGVAGALLRNLHEIEWRRLAMPWPVFVGTICLVSFVKVIRRGRDGEARSRLMLTCMLSVFALALLGKMVLNTRLYHYGFALAMPATLLIVVALVEWIPAFIGKRGGYAWVFRGAALAALIVAVFVHVQRSHEVYSSKTYPVASGADLFWADKRGEAVNAMLGEIQTRVPPGATLAVLPEGVMINYLARRINPTPYVNFMPPELTVFGEERMLAAFQASPPDYVVLVHKDTSEYGPRFFGRDYGRKLYDWIRQNYHPISRIGAPPLQTDQFGILLLGTSGQ